METYAEQLEAGYIEWRRMAEAEGKGIRAGNWAFVADCQRAASEIRARIQTLSDPGSAGRAEPSKAARSVMLQLIELQRSNLAALQKRRDRLTAHVQNLIRADKNLRGLQRSYAKVSNVGWSSYS